MKGAVRYEIRIEKNGVAVLSDRIGNEKWQGDLPFGVYAYEIRAYDRILRPGQWSAPRPLVVMSAPPQIEPRNESEIFHTPTTASILHWEPVSGASLYEVELLRDGSLVLTTSTKQTELRIRNLVQGNYTWRVSAIFEAQDRSPAAGIGRRWETKPSEELSFDLKHELLEAPDLKSPKGTFKPPKDDRVILKWSSVKDAEVYEVILEEVLPVENGRGLASRLLARSRFLTKKTRLTLRLPGEGHYTWQVRALASLVANDQFQALGEKSSASFVLDRNASFFEGSGYIAFSTIFAPYTYSASSSVTNAAQAVSSSALTPRLSGEYWFEEQWGFAANFDNRMYSIENTAFNDKELQLAAKYRVNLSSATRPWTFYPEFGFQMRQYSFIVPTVTGSQIISSQQFTTAGPVTGFDLRKQLSERLSLGGQLRYYFPVATSGGAISRDANSNRNLSIGLQGLYWLDQNWGAGAGVFIDKRSISVESGPGPESVTMDGTYFFGSIVWSFGR